MPPILALIIIIIFILYLFWKDGKQSARTSRALWFPFAWMFLAGSRYASAWLDLKPQATSAEAMHEGSPIDALVFFSLIAAGILILRKRHIDWASFLKQNKSICLYFLYCGISIIWADYAFVSFKRYIKELGNVVMVLVILTEAQSFEAILVILKRLSFLMVPLSVLFVKYYPELGRGYHQGRPEFQGVSQEKNGLGQICLITGIYFAWKYYLVRKKEDKLRIKRNISDVILIVMIVWLLLMSDSATSMICITLVLGLFFICRKRFIAQKPGRIVGVMVVLAALYAFIQLTFDVNSFIIVDILGRRPDLTTRVPMWLVLKEMVINPMIGSGYMSFWSLGRIETIWEKIGGARLNNAHNGYLEQYLNLGYIGVALTLAILAAGLLTVRKYININYQFAVMRLTFIAVAIVYNYTEASFYGISNMWLLTLLAIIDISPHQVPKREDIRRSWELGTQ